MPRSVNPSSITHGAGLKGARSVDAASFVNPDQGLDSIKAHIVDPSGAHAARAISVQDVGGYFSSENVEGALQEIAVGAAVSRSNGAYKGCGYSAVGLSVTIDGTSSCLVEGTEVDISGDIIALTDNATNWLYVSASTRLLTVATGASAPSIAAPENVLLWRLVTVAGAITAATDARFYVRNVDRKLPFTVRTEGTSVNQTSEACFVSLDAVLLYLDQFVASSVISKTWVYIRGNVTVSSTLTVPVSNIIFQGEDGATLTTGASVSPMFNLSQKDRIQFRDLEFVAAHATSVAIADATGGNNDVVIERCRFTSGASAWTTAVSLPGASAMTRFVARGSRFVATGTGLSILRPADCVVQDCSFTESGSAGVAGLALGASGTAPNTADVGTVVRGCNFTGFGTGIYLRANGVEIEGCYLQDCDIAVDVGSCINTVVANTTGILHATTGTHGIRSAAGKMRITGVRLESNSTTPTADPRGLYFTSACENVEISACEINGFLDTSGPVGYGIQFAASGDSRSVSGCVISTTATGIELNGGSAEVQGCRVVDVREGLVANSGRLSVAGGSVEVSSTLGLAGIYLSSSATGSTITGVNVQCPRTVWSGEAPVGISINASQVAVSTCVVDGFHNAAVLSTSAGIYVGAASQVAVSDCVVRLATRGIFAAATSSFVSITGCSISEVEYGYRLLGDDIQVVGGSVEVDATNGLVGMQINGDRIRVTATNVACTKTVWATIPMGIHVNGASEVTLQSVGLSGWVDTGVDGHGVYLESASQVTLDACTLTGGYQGIGTTGVLSQVAIRGCALSSHESVGVALTGVTGVQVEGTQFRDIGDESLILVDVTDVVVSGNQFDAGATSTTACKIHGDSTEARRVAVSNNTLYGYPTYGIWLLGAVQDAVLSANQIDGYLTGATTNPTGLGILLEEDTTVPSRVRIEGNGITRCAEGVKLVGLSATPLFQIVVTENSISYCAKGAGTAYGINVAYLVDSSISNNRLSVLGKTMTDAGAVSFPTSPSAAVGLGLLALSRVEVAGNQVVDLYSQGASLGDSVGAILQQTNMSPAWAAEDIVLRDNSCTNDAPEQVAYGFGVLLLPGTGSASSLEGLVLQDNVVTHVDSQGITLAVASGCSVTGVHIEGNVLRDVVRTTTGNPAYGISLVVGATGTLEQVVLQDNQVSGVDPLAADSASTGIYTEVATTATAFSDWTVQGNAVYGGVNGIALVCNNTGFHVSDITLVDNLVQDLQGTALLAGTVNAGAETHLRRLIISRNKLYPGTGGALAVAVAGTLTSSAIQDNICIADTARATFSLTTTRVTATEAIHQDLRISGNLFKGGTGVSVSVTGDCKIQNWTFDSNTFEGFDSAATALSWTMSGQDAGTAPAIDGLSVSNNSFSDGVGSAKALYFSWGGGAAVDDMVNVSVCNNSIVDYVGTATIDFLLNGKLLNSRINGNLIQRSNAIRMQVGELSQVEICNNQMDNSAGYGVRLYANSAAATFTVDGVAVRGNTFRTLVNDAVRMDWTSMTSVSDVYVQDNTIDTVSGGGTDLGVVVICPAGVVAQDISVTGNRIRATGNGAAVANGAIMLTLDGASNVQVTNNQIRSWASDRGIYVSNAGATVGLVVADNTLETGTWTGGSSPDGTGIVCALDSVAGLTLSRNRVTSPYRGAIYCALASGANGSALDICDNQSYSTNAAASSTSGALLVTGIGGGLYTLVRVDRNTLHGVGTSTNGVYVDFGNATNASSVSVSHNQLYNVAGVGVSVVPGGTAKGWAIDHNSIMTCDGGVSVSGSLDAVDGLSISRNSIVTSLDYGISLSLSPVATSDLCQNVQIVGNGVDSCRTNGLDIWMRDSFNVQNFQISGNAFTDWGTTAGTTVYKGLYLLLDSGDPANYANSVSIQGNTFKSNSYCTAIAVDTSYKVRGWSIQGNTSVFTSAGGSGDAAAPTGTTHLTLDTNSVTAYNLVCANNVFRNSDTGVTATTTNWQQSVVMGNIGDHAANNWTTLTAGWTGVVLANNINNGT